MSADPVVSVAVETRTSADNARLTEALAHLVDEDPSLRVATDPETGQTVLSGLGELHLEVAVEKARTTHRIEITTGRPRVSYRETVASGVKGFVYRHVKQDGGAGQFAHVVIDTEPLETGFEFRSAVTGGRVPQEFVRAVEHGCRDALAEGPLGHPVTGLRVTLTDGSTHVKDSSEMAFRTAGRLGLREALKAGAMMLLEPIAEVTVTEVTSTLRERSHSLVTIGSSDTVSPTLAPCTQTSGPFGRARPAMPRRSPMQAGSSLPRRRRWARMAPAKGCARRVAAR